MAEQVPSYGQQTPHPWNKWMGKPGTVVLVRGRDYCGRTDTMAVQLRARSKRLNRRLRIRISNDGKSLTVTDLGER